MCIICPYCQLLGIKSINFNYNQHGIKVFNVVIVSFIVTHIKENNIQLVKKINIDFETISNECIECYKLNRLPNLFNNNASNFITVVCFIYDYNLNLTDNLCKNIKWFAEYTNNKNLPYTFKRFYNNICYYNRNTKKMIDYKEICSDINSVIEHDKNPNLIKYYSKTYVINDFTDLNNIFSINDACGTNISIQIPLQAVKKEDNEILKQYPNSFIHIEYKTIQDYNITTRKQ